MQKLLALFSRLLQWWHTRKRYHFGSMPDWMLALFGGASFLEAGYWGLALSEVVPDFMKTVNKLGYIDMLGGAIGLLLMLLSIQLWFLGAIAARCHSILFERWFK
jgi:hypothetical protein